MFTRCVVSGIVSFTKFTPDIKMKVPVIYKIRNVVNQKFYVGSTGNKRERFRTHRNKLRSSKHHCAHLQAAWNKYGEDCFVFEVVEVVSSIDELQKAEDVWLSEWVGNENCYNHGLRSGAPWRGVAKELHPNFGRVMSEDQKGVLRKARLAQPDPRIGKKHTEETKQRISTAKMANPSKYWQGKTRSDETKIKISEAQKGVKKAPRVYTEEGLRKAQETMKRNARPQEHTPLNEVLAKFPEEVRNKYDFTNAIYTGALNRITGCICPTHGEFSQYAAQFRKGSGCAECGALIRNEKKRIEMKMKWSTEEGRKKMGREANKIVA
jgi:group I intron endonuclease